MEEWPRCGERPAWQRASGGRGKEPSQSQGELVLNGDFPEVSFYGPVQDPNFQTRGPEARSNILSYRPGVDQSSRGEVGLRGLPARLPPNASSTPPTSVRTPQAGALINALGNGLAYPFFIYLRCSSATSTSRRPG